MKSRANNCDTPVSHSGRWPSSHSKGVRINLGHSSGVRSKNDNKQMLGVVTTCVAEVASKATPGGSTVTMAAPGGSTGILGTPGGSTANVATPGGFTGIVATAGGFTAIMASPGGSTAMRLPTPPRQVAPSASRRINHYRICLEKV